MADQESLLKFQGGEGLEQIVCRLLHAIPGGRLVRGTDSSSCDAVHMELIRQLGSEPVVHMRTPVTREQYEGRARSAPVQHFQFD
jgi:hypothetical protein